VKWLSSKRLAKKPVAMACEIQLIYKPYFFYRKNVHFLYKVLRSEDLSQFLRDFAPKNDKVRRNTLILNSRRAEWAKERNTRHSVRMVGATHGAAADILPVLLVGLVYIPAEVSSSHRNFTGTHHPRISIPRKTMSAPKQPQVPLPMGQRGKLLRSRRFAYQQYKQVLWLCILKDL